jgi:lysophospholipase L1-like esterase
MVRVSSADAEVRSGDVRRYGGAAIGVLAIMGIAVAVALWRNVATRGEPGADARREVGLPRAMAAIGDSITQAVNLGFGGPDAAALHSWATGRDTSDPVVSHLERLSEVADGSDVVAFNNSVSGARMEDAPRQARVTVSQDVDYVTFLMGANDACAPSRLAMTSVRSFRRDLRRAIDILITGLPDATVYIVSIPDVYRLWEVVSNDPRARETWRALGTCRALLAEGNTKHDRLRVRARVSDYNEALEEVCRARERCHYDGGAVFRYPYGAEDVSPLDFFHPSITGQSRLAEVSWRHGPWTTFVDGSRS